MADERAGVCNKVLEWSFDSGRGYDDAFNDVGLDVVFEDEQGAQMRVPAYWAGGQQWRVRFAAERPGRYSYRTVCSDAENADLHGREGAVRIDPYTGDHPLWRHGPLRVAEDRRHLEHADGTPFFWLADTWWMGLCRRLEWPDEFQLLTADRVAKGFTVIQIVAGLYPDMGSFDERGANEAGFPWEADYARINPAYFEMADLRFGWLVRSGLVPCILGCWGYYLRWLGPDRMRRHWRYLVARYGAFPVVWCLAGEGAMPWYLTEDREGDVAFQKKGWTEIARYLREIDTYGRPITIHPTNAAREQVEDPSVLDFDMLQTGHDGWRSLPNTVRRVRRAVACEPVMPVINGEVCYEGILEGSRQEVQRFAFWSCMLSGTAGHSYGAQGIWCLNRPGEPFGPSPWGSSWGDRSWQEASRLPGSAQVGVGKRILEGLPWWRFEPHQEWVDPSADEENWERPFAAGIPGQARVVYFPRPILPWAGGRPVICGLEDGVEYRARFVDPKDGRAHPIGAVEPDAEGRWTVPQPTIAQDWVLVLERSGP